MDANVIEQPTARQLLGFVSGDPVAVDEVMRLIVPQLRRWAVKHYPNLPSEEVVSTVHVVCAETCKNVSRYDPAVSKITTYIINLIRLRLNDVYEDWKSQQDAEEQLDRYENLLSEPYNQVTDKAVQVTRERFFAEAELVLDNHEREILKLMRIGERSTEVYAALLPRSMRQGNDDARVVKNVRERLIRKLQAVAANKGYVLEDFLYT